MPYTDTEWSTITHALRVAAEGYSRNATELRRQMPMADHAAQYARLAEQFEKQAREARALAEKIEEQEGV
jgi:hypothetical protein